MAYKTEKLNPSACSFTFRMDEYDCYALRTGLCSLYLSDNEAAAINKNERISSDSNVMYCRVLKDSLLDVNYYEDPKFQSDIYSIRIHRRDCGHYVFTDGQHRTCIAKQLDLNSMYVSKEIEQLDSNIVCPACFHKTHAKKEKKLFPSLLSLLQKKDKLTRKIPYHFIDKEYIVFKNPKSNHDNEF